jgi:acyl transferase domain-containing protein/SAM-dependent methyltransferase
VGRSALNQHKQEQLKALQNLGSEVLYLTADISHWDDMSRVIQTTKEKFGNLQGVIHSALVMASGLIKNMNEGIFKQALEPKFKGSFILNQLLSKEKLDFLLFFSSIITFRGDKGGSNYAAGCAFQDAYTHFLRTAYQRPSITINWGRWGEVGVTANARFKKVKGLDIDVLQTQEGIQALQTVITSGTPRIIIAKLGEEWLNSDKQISNENTFVNQIITQKIETEILQQQLNQGLELGMIEVEQYAQLLLLNAFQSMQLLQQEGESYTKSQLKAQIGLLEKYDRLFEVLLEILERNGIVQLKNTHIIVTDKITQPELQHRLSHISTERAALLHAFPDKQAHVNLLDAGLTSLQDILTGQIKATERLFPDSSLSLVERFYQENRFADYYNHLVAKYIQYEIETRLNQSGEQQPVRILELGAGTGGTSVKVLEQIAVHGSKVDYCYTDISMAFVKYGKQQLGPTYPFMRFSLLNIEEVSEQKRTELGKFDIIFATNVVHATKNLSHTFSEIKQLLKPQGCLLLNELTYVQDFLTLTFGLLDGWWLFEDAEIRLPHSPLLSPEHWQTFYTQMGFEKVSVFGNPSQDLNTHKQCLIVGYNKKQEEKRLVQGEMRKQYYHHQDRRQIINQVTALVAKALDVSPHEISLDDKFSELGIDSILGVELVNDINKALNEHLLSTTTIFDYPTIKELSEYIWTQSSHEVDDFAPYDENRDNQLVTPLVTDIHLENEEQLNNYLETVSVLENNQPSKPLTMDDNEVAIIGMSGQFPGADNLEEFWDNIANGKNAISEIPKSRWDNSQYFDSHFRKPDKAYCKHGGFLADIDKFDPLFFNISPKEAELMDPQQRLFLEHSWKALEDAGYASRQLSGQKVGIYVGMRHSDYLTHILENQQTLDAHVFAGNDSAILAARLAYYLNLKGPSLAIDSACSSSLVAIHLAAHQIRTGQITLAIAGGVLVMTTPQLYTMTLNTGMLSPEGQCKTFDNEANGFVPAEGVGVVVLKSLTEAIKAGDHIYGVIKSSGINQDGKTNGITAPSTLSQTNLELEVYKQASINPETISYVEAHGTGTKLGDPIEVEALTNAYRQYTQNKQFCAIGSVKTNIGHTMFAAGVAGVIKVLLALKHKKIPPSIHFKTPNEHINFKNSPFYVPTQLQDWHTKPDGKRRAAVSAFGFSGTNAHLVIEEYIRNVGNVGWVEQSETHHLPQLIVLSAKNRDRLKASAQQLVDFLVPKSTTMDNTISLQARQEICQYLLTTVSDILKVSDKDINLDEALTDYGFDAMGLTALSHRINDKYQLEITPAIFSEYSSINALVQYLADRFQNQAPVRLKESTQGDNRQKASLSLANVAYTLQVGRFAMEERLAIVVSSLDELTDKLTQYLQDQTALENVYQGNVKTANDATTSLLIEGKSGKAFLKVVTEEKELDKLAQLWVAGVEIDWELLYSNQQKPPRISLPTYPFAKERYWLPENKTAPQGLPAHNIAKLHPLLDSNTSTLQEQKFTTILTGHEFYLVDHIIAGQKVLPGVAYLEMARAAGQIAGERPIQKITNVTWSRPITLSESHVQANISLYPSKPGIVDYEVTTLGKEQQRQVHVQGKLKYADASAQSELSEFIDIETIKARCTQFMTATELYACLKQFGAEFGNSFQVVQEWFGNQTESLSTLKLPSKLKEGWKEFVLHPSLLDGSLQTASVGLFKEAQTLYVPFTIGELEILRPLTENCHVYATLADKKSHGLDSNVKAFNIQITDESGQVLVRIKNFSLRAFRSQTDGTPVEMYYQSVWEKALFTSKTQQLTTYKLVLLFDTDEKRHSVFQEQLKSPVILIKPAHQYQQEGRQSYGINPNHPSDYRQLLASLSQHYKQLPSHIIHLWSQTPFVNKLEALEAQLDLSLYSVFHLSQALLEQKPTEKIQLLYIYLESSEAPQPQYAALSGFAKTIALENSKLVYKTIALPTFTKVMEVVLTEFQIMDSTEIRYQDNQRWRKRWQELDWNRETANKTTLLKENGVYLITGGAGGLGLIFAEYLAKQVKAQLVLSGRSALNDEQATKIQSLNALGASVIYLQADVSKRDQVEALITQTKSHFGHLNGIIHAAGVIRDALILKKPPEEIAIVLAPKVFGTLYLDEATKTEPLDFFVLFSGVAAIVGNVGQCDYTYANCFMDNLAQWREELRTSQKRFGKTLSINWPLWQGGGMQVDEQTEQWFAHTIGMTPLSSKVGLKAFAQGLTLATSQFMVIEGNRQKVKQVLGIDKTVSSQHIPTEIASVTTDNNPLPLTLQQDLLTIASAILKINLKDMGPDDNISEYGFDSISFTELANRINEKYQLELTPAIFFEYPSIGAFSQFLYHEYQEHFLNYYQDSFKTVSITTSPTVSTEDFNIEAPQLKSRFIEVVKSPGEPLVSVEPFINTPIAIIGMSGVMPQSEDLESFWQHLVAGDDLITEVPSDRWDWQAYYGDPFKESNKTQIKWGGFMPAVDKFDAGFFNISAREAELMDPQQRIFLETVWKAIEDAGYKASDLSGTKTGVFAGIASADYSELVKNKSIEIEAYTATGTVFSILANRISYLLNLQGPSESIDTACSSSLIAIHKAVEAIHSGTCDMAIAGGVQAMITPTLTISFSKAGGMLSEDGRCKTFDKSANGYVRGEGVGAILLKPLAQAEADGDNIYAVIKGSAENHGGHATSLTAPNPNAQAQLLINAYEKANIDPSTVSYIEAHGTGTSLGDPIEINGLKNAFADLYKKQGKSLPTEPHCGIGSVKTNIGHLETTAGMAGVFKVLLAMQHKTLPRLLHFKELNPYIHLQETPFYLVTENRPWTPLTDSNGQVIPRRAGVSSFGFGGANAHIVLEEYTRPPRNDINNYAQIIVLSAKNKERLQAYAKQIINFIERVISDNNPTISLTDFAYTLQIGREAMEERLAMVASSLEEVKEKLTQYHQEQTDITNCYQGNVKVNKAQSELLVEGEAGQAFLNIIIEKRELHKLAQLWIAAVNIDWKLLYPNHTLQRISLPTYPFAKERYWVPEPNSKKVIDNQFGPIAKLHPLLDKNTSTLLMQKFTTQLMGHEFYLADHILGNHRVLPGVAYLEMARAAGEIAGERTVYKLTNIIWARPINVPEPTNVEISLTPEQQQIHFEISTLNENQQKQKHCQGNLVYQNGVENYSPEFLDIEAIKARCPKIISTTDLYATLQKWEDVDLKSNFQVIQKLWTNDTEALSRLELLPQRQQDRNEFWLHPLLMDGSVQTAILGILRDIPTVHVHVPFGMGEVEILGDLTNCHYAYATLLADKKQSTKKFNTYLLDETGQVLVRIKDFLVREFQPRTDNAEQGKPEKPNLNEETILISTEAKKEPEQQVTMTPMEVTDKERLLEKLQQDMLSMAATIIKTDKQKIVLDSDLSQYGFESISLTEFANRLNDKYQLAITPALFFEHVSLGAISKSLCEEYQKQLLDYYQGSFKTVFPTTSPVRLETQPVALEQPEFLHRFLNSMKVPSELSTNMPIAIIGMSGMMPQSENLEIFWQHLENGDDLITEVPPDRWDWQSYYGEPTLEANKTKIKWGGFMPAVDEFDPLFFGISPREAELMDPQHRLFLETVWKTIEDAGYKISDLSGTKTGMFVGVATDDYKELLREKGLDLEIYATTGTVHVMVANRVSYLLDLQGPSESINTACSSALVAIHRAVQAIRHEKCEMAIAGGVNVILTPSYTISLGKAGDMLSEDGHCKSFDQSANGYVRSEGVGAILLKPLAQAELDGDTIYAVIKGSAENHGGHATSLTAPNSNAQAQLLINAYEQANLDPTTISYIEAHGTGTRIGDPVEINGLKNAFAQLYKKHGIPSLSTEPHCGVGSVKTNIGHLETASGIAGIFKVVLSMQHHKLPRLLHFKEQNAYIDLQGSPFYLVTENRPWTSLTDNNGQAIPRRAGVSSFGFGGSNAHIILEEYLNPLSPSINSSSQLIVLSAKNEERLKAYAKQLVNFLNQKREHNPLSLADIAYTLQVGREAMEERLAILVSSLDELSEKLTQYSQGQPADFYLGNIKTSKAKSDLLIEGKEGEEFVKTIIHDFRLNKLAQLWVSGIDIDWKLLHSSKNTQPKRISLPTYPFARQRYWIPAHPQNNVANSSWSQVTQSLHPLLDSNESTLEEQYYKKVFYREAFYLKDHVIDGQAILPGVVYLEMARAAGHLAKKKSPMRKLSHIIWAKPIMVSDRPETTYISLYPDSSNQVNFEVSTLDNNQQPQLHAQGKLSNDEQMTLETIDIAAIQARCPEIKARSECYQLFSEIGFHYGPSFQTIETLYCNNIEALSRLVLSAPYQKELNHFILHPSLMDGALQTVSGLPGQITTGLYLPFGLGELIITTECLPEICYAHVTLTETSSITDSQVKKFNIQIVEETGRVLVSMKDFSVRKVQASSNPVATEDNQLLDLLRQLATGKLNTQEVKELM